MRARALPPSRRRGGRSLLRATPAHAAGRADERRHRRHRGAARLRRREGVAPTATRPTWARPPSRATTTPAAAAPSSPARSRGRPTRRRAAQRLAVRPRRRRRRRRRGAGADRRGLAVLPGVRRPGRDAARGRRLPPRRLVTYTPVLMVQFFDSTYDLAGTTMVGAQTGPGGQPADAVVRRLLGRRARRPRAVLAAASARRTPATAARARGASAGTPTPGRTPRAAPADRRPRRRPSRRRAARRARRACRPTVRPSLAPGSRRTARRPPTG